MQQAPRLTLLSTLALMAVVAGGCGSNPVHSTNEVDASISDVASSPCEDSLCPAHSSCDSRSGQCVCDPGYEKLGPGCVLALLDAGNTDADTAESGDASLTDADTSDADTTDADTTDADETNADTTNPSDIDAVDLPGLPPCAVPQAVTMTVIHAGAVLQFQAPHSDLPEEDGLIQVGSTANLVAQQPDQWLDQDTLSLDETGMVKVFARTISPLCQAAEFVFTYDVHTHYPPPPGQVGSDAVPADAPAIVGWASGVHEVHYGAGVSEQWKTPEKALGAAGKAANDVVCLGDGGSVTLTFSPPIANGPGPDLAVFENGFTDTFLELAFVEVSSDAVNWLLFDSAYLGQTPIEPFGNQETALIGSLAGKYRIGFGTPFDLEVFVNRPEVLAGVVDLHAIQYVRIVDIPGNGNVMDSFGNPIYDPHPTTDSVGFDLDAVAVLNL